MRRVRILAFLISASAFAASAMAQATPKGMGVLGPEGANILMISQAPGVQTELKMTDKQKTDLFEVVKDAQMKGADLMRASMMGGPGNPQAMMAEFLKFRQENEKAVAKILEPKQTERLAQIVYRVEGPLSIARQEVSAKLKLSPKQYQQVQDAVDQWRMAQRQLGFVVRQAAANGQFDPGQFAEMRKQVGVVREAASKQIGKVLTQKQRESFDELLGEPFDLTKIDPTLAEDKPSEGPAPSPAKSKNSRTKKTGNPKGEDKTSGR